MFTQEDIAQMIGSARETVTRLLTALRRRNIIQITSDSILIRDRGALENMLESKDQIDPCCAIGLEKFEAFLPRKSLYRYSKEITKPVLFAQTITLSELARSETCRTIPHQAYERTDEHEYGFGGRN